MASKPHQAIPEAPSQAEQMGCLGLVVRMPWLAFGNLALLAAAAYLAKGTASLVRNVVFLAVAVGLVVGRYLDVAMLKGRTSEGKPATIADWRRYAAMMAVVSIGLWALARFAASRGLR